MNVGISQLVEGFYFFLENFHALVQNQLGGGFALKNLGALCRISGRNIGTEVDGWMPWVLYFLD